MKVLKRTKAFEVRLYMGSRKGYGEEQYAASVLLPQGGNLPLKLLQR